MAGLSFFAIITAAKALEQSSSSVRKLRPFAPERARLA
jgi:hypothetical protein